MTEIHRRNALSLFGAGMAFLAGCSESSETDGELEPDEESDADDEGTADGESTESIDAGDLPSYASLLPDTEGSAYFYGAIGFDTVLGRDESSDEPPSDPLVMNPLALARLSTYGITQLGNSPAADAFSAHGETTDESEFVYVDGVYAITGAYDRDALADDLEAAGYDRQDRGDAYAVYADADSGEVVGVTEDVYAYSYRNPDDEFDSVAAVERTVATAAGELAAKHETDDDFAWLLRAGRDDGLSLGLYTDADEFDSSTLGADQSDADDRSDGGEIAFAFDSLEGAAGLHQQLSIESDGASASAVVTYGADDRVDESRLESALGTDATTVEFVRDGAAVAVEATYADDVVEE